MPKNYSLKEVAKLMNLEKEYEENKSLFPEEDNRIIKEESLIVNIALWVLSGSIFSLVWNFGLVKNNNSLSTTTTNIKKISYIHYILSIILFPYSGILYFKLANNIKIKCDELNIKTNNYKVLGLIFGLIGLGIVPLIILQKQLNKIAQYE